MKLAATSTFEPLGNIRHHRYSRALNLVTETEIFCKGSLSRQLINAAR